MTWTMEHRIVLGIAMALRTVLTTNTGTEFILSFIHPGRLQKGEISVIVIGKADILLTITSPDQRNPLVRKMTKDVEKIQLPLRHRYSNFAQLSRKGINVTTSSDVTVYGLDHMRGSTAEFMCLPTNSLSRRYVVVNFLPMSGCETFFSVIAIQTSTKLRIIFKIGDSATCYGMNSGDKRDLAMDILEVYGIQCMHDLTGTVITSDKVVVVMTGSYCPHKHAIVEMTLPVKFLGTSYVLAGGETEADTYRLVAPEEATDITASDGSRFKIRPGHPEMLKKLERPLCITSNKPIYVLAINRRRRHRGHRGQFQRGPRMMSRRHPGRRGSLVPKGVSSLHRVQSSGQFRQEYRINMEAQPGSHQPGAKALTVTIHRDFCELLISTLEKISTDGIRKNYIKGCPFMVLTTRVFQGGVLHLQTVVPFGLTVHGTKIGTACPGLLIGRNACPTHKGFIHFAREKLCLKYEKSNYSRREAKHVCHRSGAHLVDIKTNEKDSFIRSIYGRFGSTILTGGHRYRVPGTGKRAWLWSDCSRVVAGPWQRVLNRTRGRRCLVLGKEDNRWKQANCQMTTKSVCEIDMNMSLGEVRRGSRRIRDNCAAEFERTAMSTFNGRNTSTSVETSSHSTLPSFTRQDTTEMTEDNLQQTKQSSQKSRTNNVSEMRTVNDHLTQTTANIDFVGSKAKYVTDMTYASTTNVHSSITRLSVNRDQQVESDTSAMPPYKTDRKAIRTPTTNRSKQHNTNSLHTPKLKMSFVMKEFLKHTNHSILERRLEFLKLVQKVKQRCHCFCKSRRLQDTSHMAAGELKARITAHLALDKSSLRKTMYRKKSAPDDRKSAAVIGCVGCMFILIPLAIIVISDINTLLERRSA